MAEKNMTDESDANKVSSKNQRQMMNEGEEADGVGVITRTTWDGVDMNLQQINEL